MTAGIGSSPPATRPTDQVGVENVCMDGWTLKHDIYVRMDINIREKMWKLWIL